MRQALPAARKVAGNSEAWLETVGEGIYLTEGSLQGIAFRIVLDGAADRVAAVGIAGPAAAATVAVA